MKQLKTETIQMPQLAKFSKWDEIFNALYPKISGIPLEDFVELKITAGNVQITRIVEA